MSQEILQLTQKQGQLMQQIQGLLYASDLMNKELLFLKQKYEDNELRAKILQEQTKKKEEEKKPEEKPESEKGNEEKKEEVK